MKRRVITVFVFLITISLIPWAGSYSQQYTEADLKAADAEGEEAFNKGDYNAMVEAYERALKISMVLYGGNNAEIAMRYNNVGQGYWRIGDYDKSIKSHKKALEIRLKVYGEKHIDTATSYNELGVLYHAIGDFDNSIKCYEKALSIFLDVVGEDNSDTASALAGLGLVYNSIGDYDRAIQYDERALKIKLKVHGEIHAHVASIYENLGFAYYNKGDYEKDIWYTEKSLVIKIQIYGEKHPEVARSYSNIGAAYLRKGDIDKAILYGEKALAIRIELLGDKHPDLAVSYHNVGVNYLKIKNYDKAIYYFEKAMDIWMEAYNKKHPYIAYCLNKFGQTYDDKGDYIKAVDYYTRAVSMSIETGSNQYTVDFSRNLGSINIKLCRYENSYTSFLAGIETIEKVRRLNLSGGTDFTSRNINSYYYAANACFLDKNMDNMFNISERMRAMGYLERLSLKSAIDASGIDPEQGKKLLKLKDDIERLSAQRQKIISANTFNMNEQQKKEREKQLEDTSRQLEDAEDEFNKLDAEFMKNDKYKLLRDSSVVTVKRAQEMCGKDGAIIEYIIPEKPDDYMKPYAIIITGNSINAVELDSSFNYSGQIEKYRKAIKENNKSEIDNLGAELYSKLIAPAEIYINSGNIKKLIIVPDGLLAFLPFDSLKTKDNKYFSERYELNLTPSVTVSCMIKDRKYDKRDNLMAFGGGRYSTTGESKTRGESSFRGIIIEEQNKEKLAGRAYNSPLEYYTAQQIGWSDLPGTGREVSAINEKIYQKKNTDVYKGENVSEENLKSLSKSGKLKKYSSIHLACHGYYDPEYPAYSAVVFSEVSGKLKESKDDGYMSVEETALLNLQSEIVVLSACETGLGRMVSGDGVIGLTRAFQVAGSNRVLVTLWPVSDEATETFMVSFYAKVRAGMGYSEALVKVKEEFRRSDKYSAPYYWAGFVLYE